MDHSEGTESRDRVARAMRLAKADRVPVMCQLALGHYFLHAGIPSVDVWHSTEGFGEALVRMQRRYGFDGILVNLPGRDPAWSSQIRNIEKSGEGSVIRWKNGWYTVCPADDNPHVFREDGTRPTARFEDLDPGRLYYVEPHGIGGSLPPRNSTAEAGPVLTMQSFPPYQFDTVDYVRSTAGRQVSIHGEVFSPFSQFLELLDHEGALMALLDDPEKCEDCLDALCRGAIDLGRGLAAHGADAILISSAFAGAGFISPAQYRRFVLPFERNLVAGIREQFDLPVYTHTCGKIGDRLELMVETGTGGIDTLDPRPLGDVDLADARKRVGDRLFLKGNLDPVNTLLRGTRDDVRFAARRCLEDAGGGGGYILSSACSVPPGTPPGNLELLAEVAAEYGRY
jgi:MtaA/CmuA family methyltransferase